MSGAAAEEVPRIASGIALELGKALGRNRIERITELLPTENVTDLEAAFRELLAPLFATRGHDSSSNCLPLLNARIYFESLAVELIAFDDQNTRETLKSLRKIQVQMEKIVQDQSILSCLDNSSVNKFWKLDGEFHSRLGQAIGLEATQRAITIIQDIIESIAKPRKLSVMSDTLAEHQGLLHALETEHRQTRAFEASARVALHATLSIYRLVKQPYLLHHTDEYIHRKYQNDFSSYRPGSIWLDEPAIKRRIESLDISHRERLRDNFCETMGFKTGPQGKDLIRRVDATVERAILDVVFQGKHVVYSEIEDHTDDFRNRLYLCVSFSSESWEEFCKAINAVDFDVTNATWQSIP